MPLPSSQARWASSVLTYLLLKSSETKGQRSCVGIIPVSGQNPENTLTKFPLVLDKGSHRRKKVGTVLTCAVKRSEILSF